MTNEWSWSRVRDQWPRVSSSTFECTGRRSRRFLRGNDNARTKASNKEEKLENESMRVEVFSGQKLGVIPTIRIIKRLPEFEIWISNCRKFEEICCRSTLFLANSNSQIRLLSGLSILESEFFRSNVNFQRFWAITTDMSRKCTNLRRRPRRAATVERSSWWRVSINRSSSRFRFRLSEYTGC